jgi:Na+/proline symporter
VVAIAVFASVKYWNTKPAIDPASVVLLAARDMVPPPVGLLLLAAAVVVVISTGMNYLLSPSTNIIRDIYQTLINPKADSQKLVALQKVFIVILGFLAFLMIFIPTYFNLKISVLKYAYFAYTIYGVAITPALIAALAWKRATKAGGLTSIISGALTVILFDIVIPYIMPAVLRGNDMAGYDPWGIPSIYPAITVSLATLVIVSLMTPRPDQKVLERFFSK